MKFGTRAIVGLKISSGFVIIDVIDNGPGIAEENREKILEPFFKVDAARSSGASGFGLGLSIVDEAAKVHGGSIQFSNIESGGLSVQLKLPLNGLT